MTVRKAKPAAERLRAAPSFALTFSLDGRPYIAKETEPYIQYWLSERDRILLSIFSRRGGATTGEAIDGYCRLTRTGRGGPARKRLLKAIDEMRSAGALVGARDDVSRYTARIVEDYLTHRPFPPELVELFVRDAPVVQSTRVLDLAGGPGDLAVALAHASRHVSLMDLSAGFLKAAGARAKQQGVNLTRLHESCNRLVFHDEQYDVVTISQALHWLDDVLVCRGLCRALQPGGSFFVIHAVMSMDDRHPLSFLLGDKSVLGHKAKEPFAAQIEALQRRLTLLFDALDAPDVSRHDLAQQGQGNGSDPSSRIVPASVSLFRQRRPIGLGFARAFMTPQHIAAVAQTPTEFWKDVEARCAVAMPEDTAATVEWGVLHFRRGGKRAELAPLAGREVTDIGFEERPRD
jgi:ubiquinone/menaquinone biosynthesis C-methylase UbiE